MVRRLLVVLSIVFTYLPAVIAGDTECETVLGPHGEHRSLAPMAISDYPFEITTSLGPILLLRLLSNTARSYIYEAAFKDRARPEHYALKLIATRPEGLDIDRYDQMRAETRRGYEGIEAGTIGEHLVFAPQKITASGQTAYLTTIAESTLKKQMELLRGSPDAQFECVHLAYAVLVGVLRDLAQFSRAGFAHNDVKPDNIFLLHGRYSLADFDTVTRGAQTTISYSPLYISPEAVQGLPTNALSDVYSLGATLLTVLTSAQNHPLTQVTGTVKNKSFSRYRPDEVAAFFAEQTHNAQSADHDVKHLQMVRELLTLKKFIEGAVLASRVERRTALSPLTENSDFGAFLKTILGHY